VVQTLFNQPHPARAAVAWQPHADIAKKLSDRGYTSAQWRHDASSDFADLGYPAKPSGFSAAHYQATRQTLTQQAQASLALLEDEYRNDAVGESPMSAQADLPTNDHLPFVMDDFGASRKSKLRVKVDPQVLKRALVQAEMAESLVVSPITSDEAGPELIVIHPDAPAESTELPDEVEGTLSLVEPQAQEMAVVGGISPEEVAEREAVQFAKGLAQAREEAASEQRLAVAQALADGFQKGVSQGRSEGLAEGFAHGLEQGRTEGHAQGLAQGMEEGKAQGVAEGLEQGVAQGRAQGIEEGKAQGDQAARDALAADMAAQRVLFDNAARELAGLLSEPKKFFEPLNRLAVHIAEQVVVGELNSSSQAIERLVQRCLDELDHPVQGAVVLELNPEDKDILQAQGGDLTQGMRLEAVHDMPRGSVRVFANDTVVEDLVTHRLESMARALLVDVDAWRETSPIQQKSVNLETEEEVEGGDVHS
jgi:flagellar biosynthesis/type III secretory pathway protein FliH